MTSSTLWQGSIDKINDFIVNTLKNDIFSYTTYTKHFSRIALSFLSWAFRNWGKFFLLTVGAFLLTVELLCLQSVEVLLERSFHCKQRSSFVNNKTRIVSQKLKL